MVGMYVPRAMNAFAERLPKELTSSVLRRGKWTKEEELYTEKIIESFENGTLDVSEGTTLRCHLSKVLNCDPMRITKKYTGNDSIGKRAFSSLPSSPENDALIESSRQALRQLRQSWIEKLFITEQLQRRKPAMKDHFNDIDDVNVPYSHLRSVDPCDVQPYFSSFPSHDMDTRYGGQQSRSPVFQDHDNFVDAFAPYCSTINDVQQRLQWMKHAYLLLAQRTDAASQHTLQQLIKEVEIFLPVLQERWAKVQESVGHNTDTDIRHSSGTSPENTEDRMCKKRKAHDLGLADPQTISTTRPFPVRIVNHDHENQDPSCGMNMDALESTAALALLELQH